MNNYQRSTPQERHERKKEEIGLCFHCKKIGHLIANYPSLQAISSQIVHKKNEAMVPTCDDLKIESDDR